MKNLIIIVRRACLAYCMMSLVFSCVSEPAPQDSTTAVVTFVPKPDVTKSSYTPQEDRVSDINMFVYGDGRLLGAAYSGSSSPVSMTLQTGDGYTVYALANAGTEVDAPADESALPDISFPVDWQGIETNGIPMSAVLEDVSVTVSGESVPIRLERLLAKYGFVADKSEVAESAYTFTKVTLKQAAVSFRPFADNAASSAGDVSDGDSSCSADVEKVNAGQEVYFYVPENRQGTLLPGNTDPWLKVPSGIGGKEGLCTYIQADAAFSASGAAGDVSFRFYLGADDCSNFDVIRNNLYHVVLYPDDDSPYALSWKMVADVSWDDSIYSLEEPAHVGSWGSLKVPGASSARRYSVRVNSGAASAEITLGSQEQATVQCGAYTLCYNPDDPETLHYMPSGKISGGYPQDTLPVFGISRGSSSITATSRAVPDYPGFVFAEGLVTNEDGYGVTSALKLDIDMGEFAAPQAVLDALPQSLSGLERKWHWFKSVFYDDFRVAVADGGTFSTGDDPSALGASTSRSSVADVTAQSYGSVQEAWEDGVFAIAGLYGLAVDGNSSTAQTFVPCHEGLADSSGNPVSWAFGFTVYPAFPEWRYLGRFENMQFSASAPSNVTPLTFESRYGTSHPTPNASWKVRHGYFEPMCRADSIAVYWNWAINDAYSMDITMTAESLSFPAAPVNGLCCGPMVCRGQVVNPVSGRTISGYYTLDLVMNLPIGARVSASGQQSSYCFTPFTVYASPEYYALWDNYFPKIHIEHMRMRAESIVETEYHSYIGAQQYPDSSPSKWPLVLYHVGREVYNGSDPVELVALYDHMAGNSWFDFYFYDGGSSFISKTLRVDEGSLHFFRNCNVFGDSSSEYYKYRDGSSGYYELTKQHKIKDIPENDMCVTLQNYILEAAMEDFENY